MFQSIAFAAGQPMYHVILPPDGRVDKAFHMVVIGDSIAWGNGLNKEDKYYYLVADWLEKKLNKPVDVTVYAHSGAKISGSKDLWTSIGDLNPFKSSYDQNMNSAYPTLKEQADSIINADKVNLILVSGGINDVDVMKLINVYTSAKEIDQSALNQSIKDPMKELLSSLLIKCKNAKIIVTNYYPIVSEDSNIDTISAAYGTGVFIINSALKKNPFDAVTIKERLTENSNMFHGGSTTALDNAVLEADSSANRITLAMINFQPNNCYAASQTWLWKLDGLLKTNDDQYKDRSLLTSDPINRINAIGHPNRDGAIEYARAIEQAITNKGLDWLEPKENDWNQDITETDTKDTPLQRSSESTAFNRDAEIDVSGHWDGKAYQSGQPAAYSTYPYSLDLTQTGSDVKGTSKISLGSDYAVMDLSGSVSNGVLYFSETGILEDTYQLGRVHFILKTANLNCIGTPIRVLEGTWECSDPSLYGPPGSMVLQKSPQDMAIAKESSSKIQSTGTTQDTSAPSETSGDTNTKAAYTQDGINFISKERLEENIKAGIAKSGDYREVQVSLDTIVVGGSIIPG